MRRYSQRPGATPPSSPPASWSTAASTATSFVADTVIKALMDVQLRTEVPIFSAVLTPQQFHESAAHFEFFRKHFAVKGIEVAEACANTLLSLERLRGQVAAGIV